MADYPKTLMELEYQFSTEEACREYLFRLRWPSGFRCPRCGHGKAWPRADGLFECQGCGHKASMKAGTIFEGSRNRRTSSYRGKLFYRLLQNAVSVSPTKYHDITKGVRGRRLQAHKM